jgi:hypothetical protein
MGVLVALLHLLSTGDEMQVAFIPHGKPGMPAIVKRLRDGVQTDDIPVEYRAFLEVHHIMGDMVQNRSSLLGF